MLTFDEEFKKLMNEDVTMVVSDLPVEGGQEVEECPIYDLYNKICEIGLYTDHPIFKGEKTALTSHVKAVKSILGRAAKKNPPML